MIRAPWSISEDNYKKFRVKTKDIDITVPCDRTTALKGLKETILQNEPDLFYFYCLGNNIALDFSIGTVLPGKRVMDPWKVLENALRGAHKQVTELRSQK